MSRILKPGRGKPMALARFAAAAAAAAADAAQALRSQTVDPKKLKHRCRIIFRGWRPVMFQPSVFYLTLFLVCLVVVFLAVLHAPLLIVILWAKRLWQLWSLSETYCSCLGALAAFYRGSLQDFLRMLLSEAAPTVQLPNLF